MPGAKLSTRPEVCGGRESFARLHLWDGALITGLGLEFNPTLVLVFLASAPPAGLYQAHIPKEQAP